MKYLILPVTPFQQNCTLFWCEAAHAGVVIDPGGEAQRIVDTVSRLQIQLEKILLTHGHVDHVGAGVELARHYKIPIWGPQEEDRFWLQALPQQSEMFGTEPVEAFIPDRWLAQGDSVEFGEQRLEVLHCPGHTPGHVVYFNRAAKLAQVGDVLFNGSIGRTDFPRGDYHALIRSIKEQLWPLGGDVAFISGHGPMSTFAQEQRHNPFIPR